MARLLNSWFGRRRSVNHSVRNRLSTDIQRFEERDVPAAVLMMAPNITSSGGSGYSLAIQYSNAVGFKASSFGISDITVAGPTGALNITGFSVDTPGDGSPRTVTYQLQAPGGTWDAPDLGRYNISLNANEVQLLNSSFEAASPLGSFLVAFGSPLVVSNNSDVDDGDFRIGKVSLREAVIMANAISGNDIIQFDGGVFSPGTSINLNNGSLNVTDGVTVVGPGRTNLTINGGGLSRIWDIRGKIAPIPVLLSKMTVTNGMTAPMTIGGGLFADGAAISINDMLFTNNIAAQGGAVVVQDVNAVGGVGLTATNCTFSNNSTNFVTNDDIARPGGGAILVLDRNSASVPVFATIDNCQFTGNQSIDGGTSTQDGAAICMEVSGVVVITNSTFTNNKVDGHGGAIRLGFGSLGKVNGLRTISNNVFTGNTTTDHSGGALFFFGNGNTTVLRNTFDSNVSNSSKGLSGGAVTFSTGAVGTSIVFESNTFSKNSSVASGGAMAFPQTTYKNFGNTAFTNEAQVYIQNSTFANNTASIDGGAIATLPGYAGRVNIRNSTITYNTSATGLGGGISQKSGFGYYDSTIVAKNNNSSNPDLVGTITSVQSSLIGAFTTANGTSITNDIGNIKGTVAAPVDPLLSSTLALNGAPAGSPLTLAITSTSSPAVNSGSNPSKLVYDQRGPDFYRNSGGTPDMGAFEVQFPARVANVLVNNGTVQRSMVTSLQLVFDQKVSFVGAISDAIQLTRNADGLSVTINASSSDASGVTVVTMSFIGGAIDIGAGLNAPFSLSNGTYNLQVLGTKVTNSNGNLDGNGDLTAGGNYVLTGSSAVGTPKLFRNFGDADGNGTVNASDFAVFRSFFGLAGPSIFDFNNDNLTNASDFAQFRSRFGLTV